MELYLLRHGSSLANEEKLVCGSCDYALSRKGIEQASNVCKELRKIPFTRIYSSPLSRAVNTIAELNSHITVSIQEQIKELNTGDVSHITLPELWSSDERYRKPWLYPDMRYPGGETFREMITRITNWYIFHAECWSDDDKILIVGHEGTLRTIYLNIMGLELIDYPDFIIGNCDYLYFESIDSKLNRFEHIKLNEKEGEIN